MCRARLQPSGASSCNNATIIVACCQPSWPPFASRRNPVRRRRPFCRLRIDWNGQGPQNGRCIQSQGAIKAPARARCAPFVPALPLRGRLPRGVERPLPILRVPASRSRFPCLWSMSRGRGRDLFRRYRSAIESSSSRSLRIISAWTFCDSASFALSVASICCRSASWRTRWPRSSASARRAFLALVSAMAVRSVRNLGAGRNEHLVLRVRSDVPCGLAYGIGRHNALACKISVLALLWAAGAAPLCGSELLPATLRRNSRLFQQNRPFSEVRQRPLSLHDWDKRTSIQFMSTRPSGERLEPRRQFLLSHYSSRDISGLTDAALLAKLGILVGPARARACAAYPLPIRQRFADVAQLQRGPPRRLPGIDFLDLPVHTSCTRGLLTH